MQIDNNILTIVFAATTVVVTFFYFRSYLNTRFSDVQRNMGDQATEMYREMEAIQRRVFALEKCCNKSECKSDKSFYNSNA